MNEFKFEMHELSEKICMDPPSCARVGNVNLHSAPQSGSSWNQIGGAEST